MNIKALIKNIDSSRITSLSDVMAVVSSMQIVADDAMVKKKVPAEDVTAAIMAALTYTQDMLSKLLDYKDYVEKLNHANLANIIADMELSIFSFSSVVDASGIFNKQWFSNLLMSDEDKQQIAQTLINNCNKYTKTAYQDLYIKIAQGDYNTMEEIRYPIEKK